MFLPCKQFESLTDAPTKTAHFCASCAVSSRRRCGWLTPTRGFPDGTKRPEKDVREIVKSRFTALGLLDSWAMHCATRVGLAKRQLRPDGRMVFGGKNNLERRRKGLITNEQWREKRLLPFVSYGDRPNQHSRASRAGYCPRA